MLIIIYKYHNYPPNSPITHELPTKTRRGPLF
nr:MAG TPA: hypothetical protein [Caudoviricetes sp.]